MPDFSTSYCPFCGKLRPMGHGGCGPCDCSGWHSYEASKFVSSSYRSNTSTKNKDWSELTEEEWRSRCAAMGGYSPYPNGRW